MIDIVQNLQLINGTKVRSSADNIQSISRTNTTLQMFDATISHYTLYFSLLSRIIFN